MRVADCARILMLQNVDVYVWGMVVVLSRQGIDRLGDGYRV